MEGLDLWLQFPIRDVVVQFTLLVTAALVVQLTVERLHLPGLIGLLLIGAVVGPGATGILPREPVVELLGEIGLIYLLFLAGVEIDLDVARERMQETVWFGMLALLGPLAPTIGFALLMGYEWPSAVLLGTLIASHTLLAYPLVVRLGLHHRPAVVATTGGTLLTDTAALIILAIVIGWAGVENGGSGAWWLPLVLFAVLSVAALLTVPRASRWFLSRAVVRPAEKALFVLATLLLLSAAAEMAGTEAILGAFLAGICLNRVLLEHRGLWEHLEFTGRMLFLPFFYISTGMLLEVDALAGASSIWILAGGLLIGVVGGKAAAAWVAGSWFGYPRGERMVMIGLTLPQAAATLAIAVTAYEADLFTREVVDAVIIVIFVTCLAGSLLTRHAAEALANDEV